MIFTVEAWYALLSNPNTMPLLTVVRDDLNAEPGMTTKGASMSTRGLRALIVDGIEHDAQQLVGELSRAFSVTFERVESVEAMFAALERGDWDVIFVDYAFPGFSAQCALADLTLRATPQPCIVVSGTSGDEAAVASLRAGAYDFVTQGNLRRVIPATERALSAGRTRLDRLQATRLALEAQEQLAALLECAPGSIVTIDREGRTRSVNRAVAGLRSADVIDEAWLNRVPIEEHARLEEILRDVLANGSQHTFEVSHVAADGSRRWFSSAIGPIRRGTNITGAILNAQEVTHERATEERLRVSDRMACVGTLVAGVAHDFNNILAAILAFSGFIHDDLPAPDARREDIEEVIKAAERAVGLVRQLASFARQQPKLKRPTDLNERLTQLAGLLSRTVGEQIALNAVPAIRTPTVLIDPVEFDQIVLNLAVNARDAMPGGGKLTITLEHPSPAGSGSVRLSVEDTGTGIDDATQARIFEPFFTTKEHGKGTGLGLATCYSIVADAGGTIEVRSSLGAGATFHVDLPVCAEVAVADAPLERVVHAGSGEHVLLVEDEPALRKALTRVLKNAGYRVHAAKDGDDAIRRIDELGDRIALVLSDVVMPGRTGYEVAEHLARTSPTTGMILTTGYVTEVARRSCADDVVILWKPVPQRELLRVIAQTIHSKRPPRLPTVEAALVLSDDADARAVVGGVLTTAGFRAVTVGSGPGARAEIERGLQPRVLLCDVAAEGSRDLLEWIERERSDLIDVVTVLGGSSDEHPRFRTAPLVLDPESLLQLLVARRPASRVRLSSDPPAGSARRSRDPEAIGGSERRPRRERVLVVDDDAPLALASRRILAGAGFEVVVAGTLGEAREIVRTTELDVVVADLGLPDGNGMELLDELTGDKAEIPMVVVTGRPSASSAAEALRSHAFEYLSKPVAAEDLVQVVRSAAEKGRMARVRNKLLATRLGGDEFVRDLSETEARFSRALEKIRMVYQPIVRASDGSTFGFEALLRSEEPTLATPVRLLAAAEVLGRTTDLGRAVRSAVAATMKEHSERIETMFINIHPSELRADILGALADPLVPLARRVVLEITERASLEATPQLKDEIDRVRALGFRLAVDDLGEGYAGLASLIHVRPDLAKIDMSLVRDVHLSPLKRDIVAALVDVSRRSNITVVAEGVETVQERDILIELGCDLLQGYLFAKPGAPFPVARRFP